MREPRNLRWTRTLIAGATALTLVACGGGTSDPADPGGGPGGGPGADAFLFEDFLDTANLDAQASLADWGVGDPGFLRSVATTSRSAYVYSYVETNDDVNSGRGQYAAFAEPLTGADLTVAPPYPAVSQGRRAQWSFSDTSIGPAGTITAVAWGPAENATVAATYPNVRLRMGYQDGASSSLGSSLSGNYDGAPTLVYDGPYAVQAVANVGNPVGQPATAHIGGYPQGLGCTGAPGAPGGHNAGLFAYTGWYPWPALTTPFAWDPGDPSVANDRRLVFDASVQAGDFTQRLRGWFGVTYPCSGILIGGQPDARVLSTYEADTADPAENFSAGILNPEPSVVDMCFTITQQHSTGQSLFFEGAFGDDTDYGAPTVVPAVQSGNAVVALQFQGADGVESDRRTVRVAEPHTDWVLDINACDGMRYLRFRFILTPDPVSLDPARVDSIRVSMSSLR